MSGLLMIKQASVADLDTLLEWRMRTLKEVFSIDESETELLKSLKEANRAYFLKHLPDGSLYTLLIEDRQPAAMGCLVFQSEMPSPDNPSGTCAYLMNIFVDPEYRHKGLGQTLVKSLIAEAKRRNTGKITLETTPAGRKLYLDCGFADEPDMMKLKEEIKNE